jgi:hypothetical protein
MTVTAPNHTECQPLAAPNVLPDAPTNFLLWEISIFPNKFQLDV